MALSSVKIELSIVEPSELKTFTISIAGQVTVLTDDVSAAILNASTREKSKLIEYVNVLPGELRIELAAGRLKVDPTQGSLILKSSS